jgi:hypothetical protein
MPLSNYRLSKKPKSSVADPDPRSGTNIPELIFDNMVSVFELKILKSFDADQDPGSEILSTLDPGWKNLIRDKHPETATLFKRRRKQQRGPLK